MRKNVSPWLHQLDKGREHIALGDDLETDVVIVGAGIAGVSTAFQILQTTKKRVVLVDRFLLAHGATGHNAGQVVGHFERGLKSLVDEFGPELAIQGQRDVEGAWDLLEHMYTTAKLDIPFFRFIGHSGYTSLEQVMVRLENNRIRKEGGLEPETLRIANTLSEAHIIPEDYAGLYEIVEPQVIREILETDVADFVAATSYKKGCINSALFCERIAQFLRATYRNRFVLFEHTPIHKIVLRDGHALLDAEKHTIAADRVVLCTNGFESLHIINEGGLAIDTKYHHLVSGKMGFMSGYLEAFNKKATAISYFTDPSVKADNSYFYLTRRLYEYEKGAEHNLVCIGGPDVSIEDTSKYNREDEYPEERAEEIDNFVHTVYDLTPNKKIDYLFTWHGLMGYTRNGVRLVGPEPKNPVLLYNLGCNGVGILTSVYGASKIARHIAGEQVEVSIFDVPQLDTIVESVIDVMPATV
jgi:glycine/D-amino acid oxidase-like deaminating enzyme